MVSTTLYLDQLHTCLERAADPGIASGQKAYLRNQFVFYGIKTPARRELQRYLLKKENLPPKEHLQTLIYQLWEKPQREFQYFGMELAHKFVKQQGEEDIVLYEYMVLHKSWWDTVDFIATTLMGSYFRKYPEKREHFVQEWLDSKNIWLQRCAVLFQLKYKKETDTGLLATTIQSLQGSREFFINKAIGWILREYSKTNPAWVRNFTDNTPLSPLSRKEGLRLINNLKINSRST